MIAPVTSIYAALLAFFFIYLSTRVIAARRSCRVAIWTGGRPELERAARVHANFAEYAPIALLLMLLAETARCPAAAMHIAGVVLIAGRMVHAWGVSRQREDYRFRTAGTAMSFAVVAALAMFLLVRGLSAPFGQPRLMRFAARRR